MALTKISTGGVKDDTADESKLKISNAGTNGQFLQKSSGTGGLTWATVDTNLSSDTTPQLGGDVDTNDHNIEFKDRNGTDDANVLNFGAGDDMRLYSDGTNGYLQADTELRIGTASNTTNAVFTNTKFDFRKDVDLTNSAKLGIGGSYGTSGQVLTSGGSGAAPSWAAVPAGGNAVELVADGAIAAGKPVIIKSNGKAAQVAETATERTSQWSTPANGANGTQMSENGKTNQFTSVVFSETTNIGCNFFKDEDTGNNLKGRYWNINSSGNANIPSASNTTVINDNYIQISSCWEATNNKFVIVAKKVGDDKVYATWTSVSSSGITPSGSAIELQGTYSYFPSCCDCGSGRVATVYNIRHASGSIYKPECQMLSWNSSSSAYVKGTEAYISDSGSSSNPTEHVDIAYHAANDKIIAVYHKGNHNVACKIGTISGSGSSMTTSWGTETEVATSAELPQVVVDVNTGKVVVTYIYSSTNSIYSKVGTISGTGISFGSEAQVDTVYDANAPDEFRPELIYLKNLKKVVYGFVAIYGGNYYTLTRTGTVSGTSISWGNQFQHWNTGVGIRGITMCDLNDSANNKIVIGGRNDHNADKGEFKTAAFSTAETNLSSSAQNFLGFAESAISDGNSGTIKLPGNIVGNQSGLTAGSHYYVKDDGTLGSGGNAAHAGGLAIASDKMMIRYVPKS